MPPQQPHASRRLWAGMALLWAVAAACSAPTGGPAPEITYTQMPEGPGNSANANTSSDPNQQASGGDGNVTPFSSLPLVPIAVEWSAYVMDHSSPSGVHLFTGLNAGLCLDVLYGLPANGTRIDIYECSLFATAQTWTWNAGQLRINDANNNAYCLSLSGGSLNANVPITVACTPTTSATDPTQLWRWEDGQLRLAQGDQCLGLTANVPQKSMNLQTYPCDANNATQQWRIGNMGQGEGGVLVPMGVRLSNRLDTTTCLDLRSGDTAQGIVETYPCNAGAAQKWVFERGTIANQNNTCIGVDGAAVAGSMIKLAACQPTEPRQQWVWSGASLQLANTDLCMCVPLGVPPASVPQLTLADCPASPTTGLNCQWLMGLP